MKGLVSTLQPADLNAVAALHCETLGGLVSMLGSRAAAALYAGYLSSSRCSAHVHRVDGVVQGFVLGSPEPDAMRRDALRARCVDIALGAALGMVRRPGLLRHVIDGVRPRGPGGFDSTGPELTYIAVRKAARGAGVGRALLHAFGEDLAKRGIAHCQLSVEASNRSAVAFYEAQGMRRVASYHQFGSDYHRYAFDVPLQPRAQERLDAE